MNEREVRRTREEVEEKERRGKGTRTEDPLAPLKPEHISGEENASMARRVPRAHTDASRSGRTGNTNGVYFCRVAAAVAGQKACGFYPAPLSVSLDSTFFSLRPRFPYSPPNRRSFHSVRLFFCCHVASAALRSRRFRPSFSLSPPLPLSLSLAPRGNRSIELALFPSFSHLAKLATILPCLSIAHPVPPFQQRRPKQSSTRATETHDTAECT